MRYLFISIILATVCQLNAQTIENIKNKSSENQQKKHNSYSGWEDSGSSSDNEACGSCMGGCFDLITSELFLVVIDGFSQWDSNIKAKQKEIPRIKSFSASFESSIPTLDHRLIRPEINLTGGLFSTELRVSAQREDRKEKTDKYTTIDWQMLVLNLIVEKNFNLSVGSGFMYEDLSNEAFAEFSTAMDFYIHRFSPSVKGRFSKDFETGTTVRSEIEISLGYRIVDNQQLSVTGKIGFLKSTFYESIDFNTFSLGVCICFY